MEARAGALRGSYAHNHDFSRPETGLKCLVRQKGQQEAAARTGLAQRCRTPQWKASYGQPDRHSHRGILKPQKPLGYATSEVVYLCAIYKETV